MVPTTTQAPTETQALPTETQALSIKVGAWEYHHVARDAKTGLKINDLGKAKQAKSSKVKQEKQKKSEQSRASKQSKEAKLLTTPPLRPYACPCLQQVYIYIVLVTAPQPDNKAGDSPLTHEQV